MIDQVKGEFQTKEPQLQWYLAWVNEIIGEFEEYTMEYIPRE